MKNIFCYLTLSALLAGMFPFSGKSQTAESWLINTPQSGTKTYIAREGITLAPGFTYTAGSGNYFSAKIDQTLLFPPAGNTYAKPDGTITLNPSEGGVVGVIPGQFGVSPTGAATYSVPIEVPPGIQGMQPNISLVYNSQAGSGIAGMCWNIGGLSMISRVPKDYYYDRERSGIIWDKTSPLALDGQRLIKVQEWGTGGTDSIVYRTESGLDKIVGYNIQSWGPRYFKVYTKNGNIFMYGSSDSDASYCLLEKTQSNYYYNLGWFLYRVTDTNNNFIEFTYTNTKYSASLYSYYYNNRITEIKYGNSNTKVASILFQYKNKSSSFTQYIGGKSTRNDMILDKIEIRDMNDEAQLTYQLAYNTVDNNDFLSDIKKSNASGESLLPLKFEWSPQSYAFSDTISIKFDENPSYITYCKNQGYKFTNFEKISGDMDGDGIQDVIAKAAYEKNGDKKYYWIFYKKQANSNWYRYVYEKEYNADREISFLLLDRDHDGRDELYIGRYNASSCTIILGKTMCRYAYHIDCYKYGSSMVQTESVYKSGDPELMINTEPMKKSYLIPGDFIGDGSTQFLLVAQDNKIKRLFTDGNPSGISLDIGGIANSGIYLSDMNGNGKAEIMYVSDKAQFYEYNAVSEKFEIIYTDNNFSYKSDVYPGDFNGDGCTDFMVNVWGTNKLTIWLSNGNSLFESGLADNLPAEPSSNGVTTSVGGATVITKYSPRKQVLDINQDGKSDFVTAYFHNKDVNTVMLKIYINTGNGFVEKSSWLLNNWRWGDALNLLKGAGKYDSSTGKEILLANEPALNYLKYVTLCKNIRFNKVIGITDALNTKLAISYQNFDMMCKVDKNIYSSENTTGPEITGNLSPDFEVVKNISGNSVNIDYTFFNPYVEWKGKGLQGFMKMEIKNNVASVMTTNEAKVDMTRAILYPYKSTVKTTAGALIGETVQTYTIQIISNTGAKCYFLKQDSLISKDALKGITVKTSYTGYDTDRNPQTILTDYGGGITSTEALTYVKKGSLFLNKISSRQITRKVSGQSNVVRKDYFFYNNKGNLTQNTQDSTNANKVQTFYGNYDVYGNPGKITTTANNISRSQTLTYTPSGRFVKTRKNDQLNETTTYNYNESKGLLIGTVDRLGTVSYEYDGFGRLILTTYPDGIKTADVLQWAGTTSGKPSNAKYYRYTETSSESPVWVWYDNQGREIRNDSYGLNAKKIMVDTEYDAKGQVYHVSEPYFENTAKTWAATYIYDDYGRIKSLTTSGGTTAYTYSGLTTTVASPSETRKTTVNSAGWVVEEETGGKKVNFTHYASGSVKTAVPQDGPAVAVEYDLQGNRTKITDPDAGIIETVYDGFGQLKSEKQQVHKAGTWITTAYEYLPSGLLKQKTRGTEITNYSYDGNNRLIQTSIAGKHTQNFGYDWLDRIVQVTDVVENNKTFVTGTEYDPLGRVKKETYPTGYYTWNEYDKYGYLNSVKDRSGRLIWQALNENARGQIISEKKGIKQTERLYDNKGYPSALEAIGITNMYQGFNDKGNVMHRGDDYMNSQAETFLYDTQNRLTNWNVYDCNGNLAKQSGIVYNSTTGNISQKSDLGNFTLNYGANSKPHALTSISGVPAQFPVDALTVTYTDFKKVKTLEQGNKTYTLTYGVDEQRRKSEYKVNNVTQETRYYSGNYEEVTAGGMTQKIHYLTGGAILIITGDMETLYYGYYDHLGSLIALVNEQGQVVERYAYDPWGTRRNPMNWTQPDTRTSWIVNRGFTGHE
ncbi:MAG: hypothetical protein FWF54_01225, partial [Candidatus Azobacteroides sp.]|nr:hypothetical protein [Candidatus Azobacteroides sp.]